MIESKANLRNDRVIECRKRSLFAFDCDGTLEVSGGPISVERLRELRNQGAIVYIVSSSLACQGLGFPVFTVEPRAETLRKLAEKHPEAPRKIYVGDTPDDEKAAGEAGYHFIYSRDFT